MLTYASDGRFARSEMLGKGVPAPRSLAAATTPSPRPPSPTRRIRRRSAANRDGRRGARDLGAPADRRVLHALVQEHDAAIRAAARGGARDLRPRSGGRSGVSRRSPPVEDAVLEDPARRRTRRRRRGVDGALAAGAPSTALRTKAAAVLGALQRRRSDPWGRRRLVAESWRHSPPPCCSASARPPPNGSWRTPIDRALRHPLPRRWRRPDGAPLRHTRPSSGSRASPRRRRPRRRHDPRGWGARPAPVVGGPPSRVGRDRVAAPEPRRRAHGDARRPVLRGPPRRTSGGRRGTMLLAAAMWAETSRIRGSAG